MSGVKCQYSVHDPYVFHKSQRTIKVKLQHHLETKLASSPAFVDSSLSVGVLAVTIEELKYLPIVRVFPLVHVLELTNLLTLHLAVQTRPGGRKIS